MWAWSSVMLCFEPLSLTPDYRGLFHFNFPWQNFLPKWPTSCTAEQARAASRPHGLFLLCCPLPVMLHWGTCRSNLQELKVTQPDRNQHDGQWEQSQRFCWFLSEERPGRPWACCPPVDTGVVLPVRGFILSEVVYWRTGETCSSDASR